MSDRAEVETPIQVVKLSEGLKSCASCNVRFVRGISVRVKCRIPPFIRLCESCTTDLKAALT